MSYAHEDRLPFAASNWENKSMTKTEIREEADKILEILISKPFAECYPLKKDFKELPTSPGIYALKSRDEEINNNG